MKTSNILIKLLSASFTLAVLSAFLASPVSLYADQTRGFYTNYCGSSKDTAVLGCTVTVTNHYTGAAATLYSDNVGAGTALANPFTTGGTSKVFTFYAADGVYDVALSGTIVGGFQFTGVTIGPTGNNINNTVTDFTPTVAGAAKVGTTSLPFSDVVVGATANNTVRLTGTFTGNRVMTIPDVAADTILTATSTATLTNKTFDTAGAGNSFSVNGTAISAKTGTGAVVLANTPTLITPVLGVATATSINKVTITAPAASATLTIADGKSLTVNNIITLAATDSQTYTFPAASDTVAALGTVEEFTAVQTFTSPRIKTAIEAFTAGSGTLGTALKPFASVIVGTAATNALTVTPAAFGQATTASVSDPALAAVVLPLAKRGTITWTTAQVNAGACTAAQTAAIAGLATTATVVASPSADDANYDTGLVLRPYATAGNVNLKICNVTAGNITPTGGSMVFNYTVFVP